MQFAVYCLMIAAKAGHVEAEFAIGHEYSQKLIISNNDDKERSNYKTKAIDWLTKAADKGSIKAIV